MKKIEYSLEQIDTLSKNFLKDVTGKNIITFTGGLGAGKTTFIKFFLKNMGVTDVVISPTFTYLNQYQASNGTIIYHFDLYRLKSLAEFEASGFFEYLYQPNSIAIIEWPEIINSALTTSVCNVNIKVLNLKARLLEYEF